MNTAETPANPDGPLESPPERSVGKQARRGRVPRSERGRQPSRDGSKLGQRWRLIQAMIELSANLGWQEVTILQLCAGAGVSQQTFYEQFADKEDVLVGAYRASAEGLFGQMRSAVTDAHATEVPRRALGALLEAVASDPDAGRVLFIEALGGGERMRSERKHAFGRFERRAEEVLALTPIDAPTLDVPVIAVVGALRHIVSRHLRNYAEDELPARLDDGLAWLYSYARAPGADPWSTSARALLQRAATPATPAQSAPPQRLPPGRHGLPAGLIARHQRTRLISATAEVTMEKGYAKTRIEHIVARARVAKPVFYRYFSDKQHAFLEAQQYPTQFILDRCAQAYYSAAEWPERLWRMLAVLIELIAANRPISHLRLVESYSAGPVASRRAEEITRAFTIFLEEGYHYGGKLGKLPPRLSLQAITGAVFEIVQRHVAQGEWGELSRHLPQLAYVALAPFIGAQEAIELVEEMKGRESPERSS
jgi:AcrR family transcriptional regulator